MTDRRALDAARKKISQLFGDVTAKPKQSHAEEKLTAFVELEAAIRRFNSQALLVEPVPYLRH